MAPKRQSPPAVHNKHFVNQLYLPPRGLSKLQGGKQETEAAGPEERSGASKKETETSEFQKIERRSKMKEIKFYRCSICGNVVMMVEDAGVNPVCCGKNMELLTAHTDEMAFEKHKPVMSVSGNRVEIKVGSVSHPMTEDHYIKWILLHTDKGLHMRCLDPGDTPDTVFTLHEGEMALNAYAYCNIHGLWTAIG